MPPTMDASRTTTGVASWSMSIMAETVRGSVLFPPPPVLLFGGGLVTLFNHLCNVVPYSCELLDYVVYHYLFLWT